MPAANLWLPRSDEDDKRPSRQRTAETAAIGAVVPFRILLVARGEQVRAHAQDWAAREGHLPLLARSAEHALRLAAEHLPEVLAVDVLYREGEGIALAVELLKAAPGAEVAFLADSLSLPEVRAAQDLGMSRFVETDRLPAFLDGAVAPLARLARARRDLEHAQREVAALPRPPLEPAIPTLPLPVAERRYRESFLRATLARTGGRRAAALLVGVPYTTLCVMLRKLGIAPDAPEVP